MDRLHPEENPRPAHPGHPSHAAVATPHGGPPPVHHGLPEGHSLPLFAYVRDHNSHLCGVWVADDQVVRDHSRLSMLFKQHPEVAEAVRAGHYRIVPDPRRAAYVMFGEALAPGESAVSQAHVETHAAPPPPPHLPPVHRPQATPPPVHAHAAAESPRSQQHHTIAPPPRDYTNTIFGIIMLVAGLTVVLWAMHGNQPRYPTTAEFRQKVGIPADAGTMNITLPRDDYEKRAGKAITENAAGRTLILEYRLDVGFALVYVDADAWARGQAVIKEFKVR